MKRLLSAALAASALVVPAFAMAATSSSAPAATDIDWKVLSQNIGYMKFGAFTVTTERDVRKKCNDLQAKKPNGVIIDLRGSDGGRYQAIDDILECFLPDKFPFMKTVSDFGKLLQVTDQKPVFKESQPVVLVMNERTANEAKIIISVLQMYRKAKVLYEMPDEATPTSQFLESARMRDYVAIKDGFTIRWDDKLKRTKNRRDLDSGDGTISQAIKMIRDASPWLRSSSSARLIY
jgi:hypothetical protein